MGPRLVELDNFEGGVLHIDEVRNRLSRRGFSDANISIRNEESATVPSGFVIRTDPPAGSMIELSSRITVWVSFGGGVIPTSAPDLIGLTRENAQERAHTHDVVALFIEEYHPFIEEGLVISQDPLPMVPMQQFDTIEVIVSLGPEPPGEFTISHSVSARITGDYIFEYYIDGDFQSELTRTQNMGLNRQIRWTVSGTEMHTYAIYITSVETGNRLRFCVYEVDFSGGGSPVHRQVELTGNIFTLLATTTSSVPEIVVCNLCYMLEEDCICIDANENGAYEH
jgi:hypothetical protein